jgi:dUTP pyrophosphatase
MKVKIKKLHPDAIIPSYAKDGDAGMDLTCVSIERTEYYVSYKIGLAFEIPEGFVGLLFPRSSNSKKDLLLCNSVGVLDSGFRGEVEFRYKYIKNFTKNSYSDYKIGDRVGQIIILPYPHIEFEEVEELSESDRGTGGFGSTN